MTKRIYRNIFVISALLIMILATSLEIFASNGGRIIDYVTSTLEDVNVTETRRWKCTIVNNLLTAEIFDTEGLEDGQCELMLDGRCYIPSIRFMKNGYVQMTLDLNDLTEGLHHLSIVEDVLTGVFPEYPVSISFGEYEIDVKHSGYSMFIIKGGTSEDNFYKSLSKYNPQANNGMPFYAAEMENLDEIVSLAKQLTANCKTDAEKALVIHNWIGRNIAYDWEEENISIAANPERTFSLKRGVCSGYARLARVMFGAIGVPCLNIQGIDGYCHTNEDEIPDWTDHEWNAVYLNGKWLPMDITRDTQNGYRGEGNEDNRSGYPPYITFFCPRPAFFYHTSVLCIDAYCDINGITVSEPSIPKYPNDTFQDVLNRVDILYDCEEKHDAFYKPDRNKVKFTGYDENKSGEQVITVSYGPWETSFKVYEVKPVEVNPVDVKPVEEKKANTLVVKTKAAAVKASAVKKNSQTIKPAKVFTVSKAQGKVTYKKLSGPKGISISSKGNITVKKGTKKGTYKLKIAVTATGNENYKAKTQKVTVIVKVK